jgi:pyruvate/2-oxoglutarate dehydrogenase complex dihydrolipoamide dehydrogenase (E3) component
MSGILRPDICVIGAGAGGLVVAAGAAGLGAETVMIEKAAFGGECLNSGCVPSKALIAAAAQVANARAAASFGIHLSLLRVEPKEVHRHLRETIAALAPNDSPERFGGLGVKILSGTARFANSRQIEAAGATIEARYTVIATGSHPLVPPIPGLDRVPFFTNETIFEMPVLPRHLAVIGAGPVGLELAQALRRLGAEVSVLEMARPLVRDDPELVALLIETLKAEGVRIFSPVRILRIAPDPDIRHDADSRRDIRIDYSEDGVERHLSASHLLIAAGRAPAVADLELDAAGIAYGPHGIIVDRGLRTSNRRVFAIGDAAGGPPFTHVASYHANIVIRRALFHLPARIRLDNIPWVTFTAPELAHVGLGEEEARQRFGSIRILRFPMSGNDRATAERNTRGLIKVITTRRGHILGADILSAKAGELIQPWILALSRRLKIGTIANLVLPYPTEGEITKRVAGEFFAPMVFSPRIRKLVRFLRHFGP